MPELKLQTPVDAGRSKVRLSLNDRILILGSCFADGAGALALESGLDVCLNPFGTLYNPVSVCNSVARLACGRPFTMEDCVPVGAGSDLFCSFSHHTSFARSTKEAFLANANASLSRASDFWKKADKVFVTLGTSWCFEHSGQVVSNCLKTNPKEFRRRRLSVSETSSLLGSLVARYPEKEFVFTVSPIRHFKDGAHGNQLSKSILLLAVDNVCSAFPERADYFPAYEIVLDQLRDYRFYAEDMLHPSGQSVNYIWQRFLDFAFLEEDIRKMEENRREARRSRHYPISKQ